MGKNKKGKNGSGEAMNAYLRLTVLKLISVAGHNLSGTTTKDKVDTVIFDNVKDVSAVSMDTMEPELQDVAEIAVDQEENGEQQAPAIETAPVPMPGMVEPITEERSLDASKLSDPIVTEQTDEVSETETCAPKTEVANETAAKQIAEPTTEEQTMEASEMNLETSAKKIEISVDEASVPMTEPSVVGQISEAVEMNQEEQETAPVVEKIEESFATQLDKKVCNNDTSIENTASGTLGVSGEGAFSSLSEDATESGKSNEHEIVEDTSHKLSKSGETGKLAESDTHADTDFSAPQAERVASSSSNFTTEVVFEGTEQTPPPLLEKQDESSYFTCFSVFKFW